MHSGAYAFVAIIYVVIGLSFVATTGVLANEFWDAGWVDFLAMDSHLFVFFPTFGIVALVAFYLPSVAFVDYYWRHVPLGKVRFIVGALVLVAVSHSLTQVIVNSGNRSIWEISPQALQSDVGSPPGCLSDSDIDCDRLPLLTAVHNLREVSQRRVGLQEFVRNCRGDNLIERSATEGPRRFCVASTQLSQRPKLLDDDTCCNAQASLVTTVNRLHATPGNKSLTSQIHAWLLPLKVFFLLVLFSISILFTIRFSGVEQQYRDRMTHIEIGLMIGTVATLFFPLMSQAFLQSLAVLMGDAGEGTFSALVPAMSVIFGLWTFLIIVFFFRRNGDNIEILTKVGSAAAGGIALVKYDVIVAFMVRVIGSGANWVVLLAVALTAIVLTVVTVKTLHASPSGRQPANGDGSKQT